MSYAILHMQKLKQPALKGIQIHNQREKESHTNPDIDGSKSDLNYDLVNDQPIDYSKTINEMIQEGVTTGKAVRKDAVRACSFLVTSDKEFFSKLSEADEKRFFEAAHRYFADKYGEKNIAYASVHKDEKTPHMHVGLVPITDDGRLSAKDFFGKKHQLVELQDEFQEHMKAAGFDLERGVSSDRKHIESARFKALTAEKELVNLENKVADLTAEANHKDRLIENQKKELVSNKAELDELERKLKNQSSKLNELQEKIEKLEEPLIQLDKIEVKESRLSNKVTLKKEDYQVIKGWAEQGFTQKKNEKNLAVENKQLKSENQQLSARNQQLTKENDRYFSERSKLKRENKALQKDVLKFKQLYEFAKEVLQRLNVYDQVKGFFEKKEKEVVREKSNELER